jgi:5-bromo-4-chloroindolyl phosphate hydrolysis protein
MFFYHDIFYNVVLDGFIFLGNLFKKLQKVQSKLEKAQTIIEELPKR